MSDTGTGRFWLIKSEPGTYSIDDLERDGSTCWEGVRNYQARNLMRDDMSVGDLCIFYHSNAKPAAAVGVARVHREAYPDHHSWDDKSPYFDPKSTPEAPRWMMVDVAFVEKWEHAVSLHELKAHADELDGLMVIKRGARLSVQPLSQEHFERIRGWGRDGVPAP